jgi:predicted transposase YdaD
MFEHVVERYWKLKDEGRAEGRMEGWTEGLEEGRAEERERAFRAKLEGAGKMKHLGVAPDIIAAGFGLSLEEIERL